MNPQINQYLLNGCMRCKLGGTPACKVNDWRTELEMLRQIVLDCGLTEELKWGVPCYTFDDKNVLLVSALKDYACLSFFKGVLLKDTHHILLKPGESSQSARILKFTNPQQIQEKENILKTYILEAIEIEKAGLTVDFQQNPEPFPNELLEKFEEFPELKKAFFALTPSRQRGYILYFSQPKQAQSRINRIEKYKQKILNGEGLNDRYKH